MESLQKQTSVSALSSQNYIICNKRFENKVNFSVYIKAITL